MNYAIFAIVSVLFVGCTNMHETNMHSSDYITANDSSRARMIRYRHAEKLNIAERKLLAGKLIVAITEKGCAASDAIVILGAVGDEDSLKFLINYRLKEIPHGQCNTDIENAINVIKDRLSHSQK